MADAIVSVQEVAFRFRGRPWLFKDLSFEVSSDGGSTIIAVMGLSGCGKTTLLRLLAGLERPNEGSIRLEPSGRLGYLPQEPILFSHLGRRENARFLTRLREQRDFFDVELFQALSRTLRLESDLNVMRPVDELSGGGKQRLCLLRSLSVRPAILLLDEPCNGLDPTVKQEFLLELREALAETPSLVFYASHHPDEAVLVSDKLLFVSSRTSEEGAVVQLGSIGDILSEPTLEIARFFASPYLNEVLADSELIGKLLSPVAQAALEAAVSPGEQVRLAFEPRSVSWVGEGGGAVEFVSQGGRHCIVRMNAGGHPGEQVRVVGPPSTGPVPQRFRIDGEVTVFSAEGHFYGRIGGQNAGRGSR